MRRDIGHKYDDFYYFNPFWMTSCTRTFILEIRRIFSASFGSFLFPFFVFVLFVFVFTRLPCGIYGWQRMVRREVDMMSSRAPSEWINWITYMHNETSYRYIELHSVESPFVRWKWKKKLERNEQTQERHKKKWRRIGWGTSKSHLHWNPNTSDINSVEQEEKNDCCCSSRCN